VLLLNRANGVTGVYEASSGGITGTVADPRLILAAAIKSLSVSIILSHNHPSGNLNPSRADEEFTLKIKEAAKYHDIKVLDHIILTNEGYYSFADEGLI
jgi:DNA repair protein RadC